MFNWTQPGVSGWTYPGVRSPELDKSRCIELGESRCTELTNQVSVQMFRRWPGHLVTKSTQVWNWFTVNYFPENSTFYTFWKNPAIKLLTWQSTEQLPLTTPRVAPFPVLAFPMGDKSWAGFEKLPPSVVSQIQIRDIALKCWRTYASTNFLQKHFHIFNAICGIHGSSVHITNDLCSTTTTFSDNYFYHHHHQTPHHTKSLSGWQRSPLQRKSGPG